MESYRLPKINASDTRGQVQEISSYLRQLVNQMNFNVQAQEEARQKELETQQKNQEEPFAAIRCYPVGSLYLSVSNTSPQTLFGGKWEQLKDRFLLAAGDTYLPGSIGGEAEVRLTEDQIPVHTHAVSYSEYWVDNGSEDAVMKPVGPSSKTTTSAGKGQAHNNMPPYLAVYVWKRIA